ncbi:adenylate kinase [Spirochaetia bacterium]|nr:adenylate kinase [Spirochaetia bacterium]
MNLIFLGPPGAGKGSLAVKVVELLNIPHISTGDIFREAIAEKNMLGLRIKAIIDAGHLVHDGVTIDLVKERLTKDDVKSGYVLDGFPRTIAQAAALDSFSRVDKVVDFNIPDEDVIKRLSGRRVCRKCRFSWHTEFNPPKQSDKCDICGGEVYTREDDKPEAVKERLEVYRVQTAPLIDYYRKKDILVDIDARPMVDQILENFKKVVL